MWHSIPELTTDRLLLRGLGPPDEEGIFALFSDPRVVEFYEFAPFSDRDLAQAMIQNFAHWFRHQQAIRWGVIDATTSELLGTCGFDSLHVAYQSANLGYNLRSDAWGQGFATEAVSRIVDHAFEHGLVGPVNRISAMTVQANTASTRVLRRLQFQHEGLLRQFGKWKGTYHDLNLYSLLKSDRRGRSTEQWRINA